MSSFSKASQMHAHFSGFFRHLWKISEELLCWESASLRDFTENKHVRKAVEPPHFPGSVPHEWKFHVTSWVSFWMGLFWRHDEYQWQSNKAILLPYGCTDVYTIDILPEKKKKHGEMSVTPCAMLDDQALFGSKKLVSIHPKGSGRWGKERWNWNENN